MTSSRRTAVVGSVTTAVLAAAVCAASLVGLANSPATAATPHAFASPTPQGQRESGSPSPSPSSSASDGDPSPSPSASSSGDPFWPVDPTDTPTPDPSDSPVAEPSPTTPPVPEDPPAGVLRKTIVVNGVDRTYLLAEPAGAKKKRPMLLLFHGLGEQAPDFLDDTGIVAAAQAAGVVLVAAESPDNAFNDGRLGPHGRNDAAYAMAVVKKLTTAGVVDPARVTVAGFSNGAGMAMLLAARYPKQFAALVSIDGELVAGNMQPKPRGPVPAYFVHGTNDPIQPLGGRHSLGRYLPAQLSEKRTISIFARANGVLATRPSTKVLGQPAGVTTGKTWIYHWAKAGATPVSYALIGNLGHKWPAQACSAGALSAKALVAMPQASHAGCTDVAGLNTNTAALSANGLVLGVAATAGTPRAPWVAEEKALQKAADAKAKAAAKKAAAKRAKHAALHAE